MRNNVLVVVDVQNDFVTGTLAVPGAKEIIPLINKVIKEYQDSGDQVVFTLDKHKKNHPSFKQYGGIWPEHCVAGEPGSELYPDLLRFYKKRNHFVCKAFEEEAYAADLRGIVAGGSDCLVCGIALDYCVRATALHLLNDVGCRTVRVLVDATVAVGDPQPTIDELLSKGIAIERRIAHGT